MGGCLHWGSGWKWYLDLKMAEIRQLFSVYFLPTLILYQLLRSPPHPPICQTMRGIATTRAQCVHKTHIGTLGISVVNQSAKIPFGHRLLLPSHCRACRCGWHWRADRAMESYTGHTAVHFHFKDLPLPLPQCVLWGHFSRFLPQTPQTSRLCVHLAFPAAHMPSVFPFTFKIAAVTSMPTGTMESTISALFFSGASHCLLSPRWSPVSILWRSLPWRSLCLSSLHCVASSLCLFNISSFPAVALTPSPFALSQS